MSLDVGLVHGQHLEPQKWSMAISGSDKNWRYLAYILAYCSGLYKGISLEHMPLYGTVPPF